MPHFLVLPLLIVAAGAHPGISSGAGDPNGGMPGQRVEIVVEPAHLRVDYYAEIAAIRLYKEARAEDAKGPEWAAGRAESLRTGVRVRVDGAELALTSLAVEKPATLKESNFVELHVAGEAVLPDAAGIVEVRMENYPDEASYYAASIVVDGALVVTETSLGHVKDGRLRDNQHGAWRRDDKARVTTFGLRPARLWEDHTTGPLPERLNGLVGLNQGAIASGAGVVLGSVGMGVAMAARRGRRKKNEQGSGQAERGGTAGSSRSLE